MKIEEDPVSIREKSSMTISRTSGKAERGRASEAGKATTVKTVTFGDVQIERKTITPKMKLRNVQTGQFAFERVARRLSEPGVSIEFAKGIPVYFADEENPSILVRELNGKRSKGIFQKGRFKAIP